ncbi:MAG: hypothetical protein K8R21_13690, partial [Leptospira sp.]|nr:hypothetical protein [Leptospira sp.]
MATKKKIKNAVKSSRIRSRKSIKSEPSGDSSVSHTKEFENYIPDKKREEKSMTSSDQNNYAGTKTSRWTIRFKMMVIISSIIVLALTFIIYLATFFFKSDNEVRIKENNIKLTDVIGQKVSTEISALSQNLKVIATTLRQNPRSRASLQKIIFENDKNIIFLGVFSDSGDSLSSSLKLYNNSFLSENSINGDDLEEVTRSNAGVFRKSFSGSTVIHNVSPGFKIPILGVSVPFTSDEGQKTIIITYIKLD